MKCKKDMMLLYAVTDRAWVNEKGRYKSVYEQVEAALAGGATCIQLREKDIKREKITKEATEISKLCKQYKVPFLIDDDVELAAICDADGVHVGQEDMSVEEARKKLDSNKIIGVSVHALGEALEAQAKGADYLGIGAAFLTSTKENTHIMTRETMQAICAAVHIPVVAIGGINASNMKRLEGSGVDGVALVSAIFSAFNIEETCHHLKQIALQTFYQRES